MSEQKTINGFSYKLGELAYNAYCGNKNINWKSKFSGADLPQFKDNLPEIQDAWAESAEAISEDILARISFSFEQKYMEKRMNSVANFLSSIFDKLGFALFVFEFNKSGISNYISNADRETMIKALEETLMRFKTREVSTKIKNFN